MPKQKWEESIEASVKMLCAFYFHKEMAKTAQRAQEQNTLFGEEYERTLFKIRSVLHQREEEIVEKVKGLKKECDECDNKEIHDSNPYNEALDAVLTLIQEK